MTYETNKVFIHVFTHKFGRVGEQRTVNINRRAEKLVVECR
jgi:hypothetical protein